MSEWPVALLTGWEYSMQSSDVTTRLALAIVSLDLCQFYSILLGSPLELPGEALDGNLHYHHTGTVGH